MWFALINVHELLGYKPSESLQTKQAFLYCLMGAVMMYV